MQAIRLGRMVRPAGAVRTLRRIHSTVPQSLDKDMAAELRRKALCTFPDLLKLDEGFRSAQRKSKHISRYDFSLLLQKLGIHDASLIDRLYVATDKGGGEMKPEEMITSVVLMMHESDQKKILQVLFKLWDRDVDGKLSKAEFIDFYSYVRRTDPNAYSLLVRLYVFVCVNACCVHACVCMLSVFLSVFLSVCVYMYIHTLTHTNSPAQAQAHAHTCTHKRHGTHDCIICVYPAVQKKIPS